MTLNIRSIEVGSPASSRPNNSQAEPARQGSPYAWSGSSISTTASPVIKPLNLTSSSTPHSQTLRDGSRGDSIRSLCLSHTGSPSTQPKLVLRESFRKTTMTLPGGTYVGSVIDNKPHGAGTLIYDKEDEQRQKRYDGPFYFGKRQGRGTLTWRNGDQYVGDFADDKITGYGTMTRGGQEYIGNLVDGAYEGRGQLKNAGSLFVGFFKKNLPDGYCEQTMADGFYKGHWANGKWDGKGHWVLRTALGEQEEFIGTFKDGEKWEGDYTYGTTAFKYREGKPVPPPCCVIL